MDMAALQQMMGGMGGGAMPDMPDSDDEDDDDIPGLEADDGTPGK